MTIVITEQMTLEEVLRLAGYTGKQIDTMLEEGQVVWEGRKQRNKFRAVMPDDCPTSLVINRSRIVYLEKDH